MKNYLLAPSKNWYRSNLHCHTKVSDGALTPEEVKEIYKWRGYSVIAYSDHNKFVPHHELTDKNFLALSSVEHGFDLGVDPSMPVPPSLVNSWKVKRCYHFNIFATDPSINEARDPYSIVWKAYKADPSMPAAEKAALLYSEINEWIATCNDDGFLVQLNHPYWSLNIREDWLALNGLWALEILNFATQRETASEYCPMVYDDMLRHKGAGLFCTMDDDNHNPPCWAHEEHSFGGSTFFAADELSYEAIADSMKKGHFFCASGFNPPRFTSVWTEDGKILAEFSPVDEVVLTGFSRHFQQLRGAGITSAEFAIPKEEPYFRLTIVDRQGNFANTSAFATPQQAETK